MSSIETDIIHDHIYLANFKREKDLNQIKKDNHRIVRKKSDIQTEDDREEYIRRRTLNNTSCRISRIHRQSKFHLNIKQCIEYEELNSKLNYQKSILTQIINQLKEHLRSLVPQ